MRIPELKTTLTTPVTMTTNIVHGVDPAIHQDDEVHHLHRIGFSWNPTSAELTFSAQQTSVSIRAGSTPTVGNTTEFVDLSKIEDALRAPYGRNRSGGPFGSAEDLRKNFGREELAQLITGAEYEAWLAVSRELTIYQVVERSCRIDPRVRDASTGKWGEPGDRTDVQVVGSHAACLETISTYWRDNWGASSVEKIPVNLTRHEHSTETVVEHWRIRFEDEWTPAPWEFLGAIRRWDNGEVRLDPIAGSAKRLTMVSSR